MPQDTPILFVVSGPSGSGKGTMLAHIAERMPDLIRIQTYTTRPKRPTETAEDYAFVDSVEFNRMVTAGELFEYTRTYEDYCYGSPKRLVESSDPSDYVVELEVKGMLRMKASSQRRVVSIFILPSSIEVLKERIMRRHQEQNFEARIEKAFDQISYAYAYDYLIVNDDRESFLAGAEAIIAAERGRRRGTEFMKSNMSQFHRT